MAVVLDYSVVKGLENETIIKESAITADGIVQAYNFRSTYNRIANEICASRESCVHWDDGHITYTQLANVLEQAVAG